MTSEPSTTNDPPQLQRDLSQKAIAGVASGIAAHLRLPVVWFRAAFVLLAFFNGLGMFLYGVLWALVPAGEREEAPGLAGATRASMRPQQVSRRIDTGMLFSAGALIAGVLWGMIPGDDTDAGRGMSLFWPLLLAGVGVVLIWFQADGGGLRTRSPGKRPGSRARTIASVARLVGGLILVGFGTSWLLASQFGWKGLQTVVAAAVALLAGWPSSWLLGCSVSGRGSGPPTGNGCVLRRGPTWPPTCTTPCCRPWP
ncbi:PspC domain-containing protein [Arachnia propionica]|uniref:PspC domain-containing protein n=1 Tax=Arachnia propionica TaxID=1750 RepID=UPI000F720FD9|nr:PspC domain-containing protein [Arachnia propionica]VEJ59142.1 phage shock protein C [Arachnia propionica]